MCRRAVLLVVALLSTFGCSERSTAPNEIWSPITGALRSNRAAEQPTDAVPASVNWLATTGRLV
jgi:hypothetical protein